MSTVEFKPTPQPSTCDACASMHDVIRDHCDRGEHCTHTAASCAVDKVHADHGAVCCDCGRPLVAAPNASVTPSLQLVMAWRLYINDDGVVTCAHDDWDPSSVGRRCTFQDMADALIAHIVTDHNGQMP